MQNMRWMRFSKRVRGRDSARFQCQAPTDLFTLNKMFLSRVIFGCKLNNWRRIGDETPEYIISMLVLPLVWTSVAEVSPLSLQHDVRKTFEGEEPNWKAFKAHAELETSTQHKDDLAITSASIQISEKIKHLSWKREFLLVPQSAFDCPQYH